MRLPAGGLGPIRSSGSVEIAHYEPITFAIPEELGEEWGMELSTEDAAGSVSAGGAVTVIDRSTVVLRHV